MEIISEAFSPLYPWAFIIVTNSLDSPHNKDKQSPSVGLSIGSAKFKNERNAIMQHQLVLKFHPVWLPVEPSLGLELLRDIQFGLPATFNNSLASYQSVATIITWVCHECINVLEVGVPTPKNSGELLLFLDSLYNYEPSAVFRALHFFLFCAVWLIRPFSNPIEISRSRIRC